MLKEEINNIKESKKDLRKFGITVGIALLIASLLLFWSDKSSYIYFLIAGAFLIFMGLSYPDILKPLNKVWMALAIILGWFMSRIILSILFYLVLTPIGLIAKIFGKRFLNLRIDKNAKSYWVQREVISPENGDYEKQF